MFQTRSTRGTSNRTTALLAGVAIVSALVAGGASAVEMSFDSAPSLASASAVSAAARI
ncbi:hypothetical protein [Arthrobacter sp. Edens01]|uniref:hypothetical protein n=1 Tax=Arthrobacter sp. Edens01 TaxID=1732020 RepID=UPI000AD18ACA|nr:hypothetical protein [Arthrobacter sp. Edens01]